MLASVAGSTCRLAIVQRGNQRVWIGPAASWVMLPWRRALPMRACTEASPSRGPSMYCRKRLPSNISTPVTPAMRLNAVASASNASSSGTSSPSLAVLT
ncbi:hypothetical protein D3C73_1335120 [compost metagenome]